MKFEYSDELRTYLDKKGQSDIYLHTISPTGCCGGAPELIIDLLRPKDVEKSMKPGVQQFDTEVGKVLMENTLIPEDKDATIKLGFKRFMGLGDITATGIRQLA